MATRYYLPSTGAADVSPAFSGDWDKTSEADRLKMVTTKISSAFATKTCSENSSSDPYKILNRQYVSDPIGVHDFTGCTWKGQVRCMEDAAKMDALLWFYDLRIVSNDGQTIRHELTAQKYSNTEFDNKELVNRRISQITVSAGSSQNGDRIVADVGVYTTNTKTDLYTATMDFGDNSGTDLPENETETTQYNPWIEFSHNIAAYVPPSGYVPKVIMIT